MNSRIQNLLGNFNALTYKYPIETQTQSFFNLNPEDLNNYFKYTYPVSSKKIISVIKHFLNFKQENGSNLEKELYYNYTESKFIHRLLKKKILTYNPFSEEWLLKTQQRGTGSWETIGSNVEHQILKLSNNLSYQEIEINNLCGMSIYTPFINKGNPNNRSIDDNDHEKNGIVICITPPKFDRPTIFDWKYMVIDPMQNVKKNGYGPFNNSLEGRTLDIWAKFYGIDHFNLYEEVLTQDISNSDYEFDPVRKQFVNYRFIKLPDYRDTYFDTMIYKQKITYLAEVFFNEANYRAMGLKKKAYCYVFPIGKNTRILTPLQDKFILQSFISVLNTSTFNHISDVYFANFNTTNDNGQDDTLEEYTHKNSIQLHVGKKFPQERLNDPNKLLVRISESTGNTLIGNEYFEYNLSNSDTSNTACSSYIAYIGNPDLNSFDTIKLF